MVVPLNNFSNSKGILSISVDAILDAFVFMPTDFTPELTRA
jgi:hypothetical protein